MSDIIEQLSRVAAIALLLLFVGSYFAPSATASDTLVISTNALPPNTDSGGRPGFVSSVVREMFKSIGKSIKFARLPAERSLWEVNAGRIDGELMRTEGIDHIYTNLVRVPEPVTTVFFVAISKNPDLEITSVSDLKGMVVGIVRGWKNLERLLTPHKKTFLVNDETSLFKMLMGNRLDVVINARWPSAWIINQNQFEAKIHLPPLVQSHNFLYLNMKHAADVPALARELRAMKKEGRYQAIFDKTMPPL